MKAALRTFLLADSTISSVYIGVAPHGASFPYVVYSLVSDPRNYTLQGEDGLLNPRFQIDAWADTPAGLDELVNAIHSRLSGYAGPMGQYQCLGSFRRAYRERNENGVYGASMDYQLAISNS